MKASRKKTILIVIASIAGSLLLLALGSFLYFKAQFSVYQDAQYKFSIEYPKTWKVIIHPKKDVAVIFMRPKDTLLDTLQENFNVTVQTVPGIDSTLPTFTAAIKKQMTAVFGPNMKIVEDKAIRFGWREGHLMAFEAPKPNHLKMVNAWVLRVDQSYILTFLGEINKYDQDRIVVNEMIRSFQLQ